MRRVRLLAVVTFLAVLSGASARILGQEQRPAEDSAFQTPEGLLTALYAAVSATPDSSQDWSFVRTMFLPEAVVILRTTRTQTSVFSVDGFIEDFRQFMALPGPTQSGFTERIVRMRPFVYHDMAHVLVLYEAHIPGSARPPQQGVDSFLLIRQEGRWRIAAITNEVVDQEHPVPPELLPPEVRR